MRIKDLPRDAPVPPPRLNETEELMGGENLIGLLAGNARLHGRETAIRERDHGIWKCYTWQDYLELVLALAAGLDGLGLRHGERVLVIGDNRSSLYIGMVAAMAVRAVPAPAYPSTVPAELSELSRREKYRFAFAEDQEQVDKLHTVRETAGGLDFIIYDDNRGLMDNEAEGLLSVEYIARLGRERLTAKPDLRVDLLGRAQASDIAVLLHSSGTTGTPKGIPLSHRHLLATVRNSAAANLFEENEVHMAYLPIAWAGDFTISIAAAIKMRFSINIPERQETALHDLREIGPTLYICSPRAWSSLLTRIQVGIAESTPLKRALYTHFMPFAMEMERERMRGQQPSLLRRLWRSVGEVLVFGPIKDHIGLSRVKRPYTGGEAIGEDVFLFFRALGLDLRQIYGQTETGNVAAHASGEAKLHTIGRPFSGIELRISEDGEILVRGDAVFDGYDGLPEATAQALRDGWLHTGDAGYIDEDGQISVLGRISELVHTAGGKRFIPTYIENRLKFSQYIKDVCVIGKDRDYLCAMVAIDFDAVGHWAQENGIAYSSYAELAQQPSVYELVANSILHTNVILPEPLRIRRFVNLHKEFDADDGEITHTRKLRRNVIERNYQAIIEAFYGGLASIEFEALVAYETGQSGVLLRRLELRDLPDDGRS